MKKIRSVIIDDEIANIEVLKDMIKKHCPSIELVGSAESADTAYNLIHEVSPDLVFLDIMMPGKTGFDLLRMFQEIDFDVIFVSGFDQFAIQAFEFNALHYILKPIDYCKLIQAVEKVEKKINSNNSHILDLIHAIDEKNDRLRTISLHHNDKVIVIDIHDICVIQSAGGYSEIHTVDGQNLMSTKTLAEYEELLSPLENFLRVNRSALINVRHILHYTKGMTCLISIRNYQNEIEVSRRRKVDIIRKLKMISQKSE